MNKLKCARWHEMKQVKNLGSPGSDARTALGLITRHTSLITAGRLLDSPKKVFLEKRSQTLPVIVDDCEKTNPKRTQKKP
jgi:hypothetical protein